MKNKDTNKEYVSKWVGDVLHIFDFTYRQNYYFIHCKTYAEFKQICKKQLNNEVGDKDRDTGGGFKVFNYGKDRTEVCYIWAYDRRDIIHECLHAISYTLRNRGLPLTDDTEEAFAYSMAFLADKIFEGIKRKLSQPHKR